MDRQEGYYWVKYCKIFQIAQWFKGFWFIIGDNKGKKDSDFEHINEVRIKFPGEIPDQIMTKIKLDSEEFLRPVITYMLREYGVDYDYVVKHPKINGVL